MELNGVTFFFDLRKTYDIAWRQRIIDLKMKKRILLHKPKNDKFLGLWSDILFFIGGFVSDSIINSDLETHCLT